MKLSDSISGESKTRVMDFESSDNASSDELRRLKRQLHQQLVANIDLAAMGTMSRDELRREVRRLPDGSRINAIIPPLALDGSLVSIRRFSKSPIRMQDLIAKKSVPAEVVDFLSACVQARLNILVSGGTGSGKTTLLNALSAFISDDERVITIEDAAELRLQQEHVGRLETRCNNVEGVGEVPTRDLVRNALRMRPDR